MGVPIRVSFAGLAHSHPYTDATNLVALGAEIVGVFDPDAKKAAEFASRFGGTVARDPSGLNAFGADICVATPRSQDLIDLARAVTGGNAVCPVFFNKVVAATASQLSAWEGAMATSIVPVGTSSVLRYAPALVELATRTAVRDVVAVRVVVQHDNAGFQVSDRSWQDDPDQGGGTLITVGVHAWEMIDRVLPGARLESAKGWTHCRSGSHTLSEDAGEITGWLRVPGAEQRVAVSARISGFPGPDAYGIEVVTRDGATSLDLDVEEANSSLGFLDLARELMVSARSGDVPAPWGWARSVVANTVRAGEVSREGGGRSETWLSKNPGLSKVASQKQTLL